MAISIETFLNKLSLKNLKAICEMMGLSKTGTKEDLIKRILSNRDAFLIVFPDLLNKASLDQVKMVAQKLELKITSRDTKKTLISKIMRKLKRVANSEIKIDNESVHKPKNITERDVKRVANLLIKVSDSLVRVRNEDQLRDTIVSILKAQKVRVTYEAQKEIEIIPGLPLSSRRDLIIEEIPVELKYIDDGRKLRSKIKEGLGQAIIYKKNLGKAILAIYDKSRTLPTKTVHKIEEGIYLVIL